MPRPVARNAASLILRLILRDAAGAPIVGVLHSNVLLVVRYRRPADTAWQTITLVAATAGTFTASGWVGLGGGWYELGLPDAAIVAGQRTDIEITYDDNPPQADSIDAVIGLTTQEATDLADEVADQVIDHFAASSVMLSTLGLFIEQSELNLRQGDDYLAAKGTALEKTITLPGFDFTAGGLTVRFGSGSTPGTPLLTGTASLQSAAVGSATLRLEFTRSQTAALPAASYQWDAELVTVDEKVITIDGGTLNMQPSWTTLT